MIHWTRQLFLLILPIKLWAADPFALPKTPKLVFNPLTLHHISSKTALNYLKQINTKLLSKKSFVTQTNSQNKLLVFSTPKEAKTIRQFIHKIDYKTAKILIYAKIILLDEHKINEIGALVTAHSESNLNIPIVSIANYPILDLKLNALISSGHAQMISNPSLVVDNGYSASIASGEELPYQEKTREGATSVTFKKALLQLKVTPNLLNDKTIKLKLTLHQDKPSDRLVNGTPAIATEQISTIATIANGQTLILGGIYEKSQDSSKSGLPLISHMPLVGALFHNTHQAQHHKLLMIFIQPRAL